MRTGALLFTAVAWLRLSGATQRQALISVYGSYGGGKRNLFGERANYTAGAVFGGSVTSLDVLKKHTFFGIYGRALSQVGATNWATFLAEGKQTGGVSPAPWTKLSASGFRFSTAELRSCSECVLRDMLEQGFASWYVLHHLPPVHHCPIHGTALTSETVGTAGGHVQSFVLPTSVPVTGSQTACAIESDGYSAYLRLWVNLIDARIGLIAADKWTTFIASLTKEFGSEPKAIHGIEKELSKLWGFRADQIAELLGNHIQPGFVAMEIQHKASAFRIAQKLIVLTACERLGFVDPGGTTQMELALPMANASTLPARPDDALRIALVDKGIPLALVPALIEGKSLREAARISGMSRATIRSAVAGLTSDQLALLKEQSLGSGRTWLAETLDRRIGTTDP